MRFGVNRSRLSSGVVWAALVASSLVGSSCEDGAPMPWYPEPSAQNAQNEPAISAAPPRARPGMRDGVVGFVDHRFEITVALIEVGERQLPLIFPSTLVVTAREGSELTVTNMGARSHTFAIEALGVYRTIRPGESTQIGLSGIRPNALYDLRLVDPGDIGMLGVRRDATRRSEAAVPRSAEVTGDMASAPVAAALPQRPWPPSAVAGEPSSVLARAARERLPGEPTAAARREIQGTLIVLAPDDDASSPVSSFRRMPPTVR